MVSQKGRCLCNSIKYEVIAEPVRVTVCHCRFCQRSTGTAYFVEPIFNKSDFSIISGKIKTYEHKSQGSGKMLHVHFCDICGTKLYLSFERFADLVGVFSGTFDDPNWFERNSRNSKHIFVSMAQHGTILPSGVRTFAEHVITNDDEPVEPKIYKHHHVIEQE